MAEDTTVRDLGASYLRTSVGIAVGTGVAWLARHAHIIIDTSTSAGVTSAFTATTIGAYYLVVRFLETKVPAFGWLLGLAKLPTYPAATNEVPIPASGSVPTK
jgi:hypothetical protein